MNILILGSAGQIGSSLVEYLRSVDINVTEFDIENDLKQDLRISNNNDLNHAVEQSDFVFFLAFDVGGSRYLKQYQHTFEFLNNNILIMQNTFDVLKEYKKPFIFASSQMSNMTYSPYGILKAIGESYTKSLNGIIVKFWNVYGYEKDLSKSHVITDFILKAKNDGNIKMLTDGKEHRQFLYSEDCCEALHILCMNYDKLDRNKNLHITKFEWENIRNVADIISNVYNVPVIPGKDKDTVQLDKCNEPDPYILEMWKPRTSLAQGITKIIKKYNDT